MADDTFSKQPTHPGVPDDESAPLPIFPKMIGPYKIESLLERGGMSILYLGTHPLNKDPVTIKVLSPKYLSNPEVVNRFLTEAEIIALADHPNIVKLYGHGEWAGGLYIAMEFVQGISLRQYLLQTPMSLKKALEIILDVAYALCHLHTHGVIHRDLKPENILVTENGQIKVIDFGISQLLTDKNEKAAGSKQRLIGTPIYMSPEQRENPETVSYPSDIYSLGIIAYELVLGKLSHGQIHISLMPKGLQKILNKTLQYKPEDRYHDIVDFITDLTAYLNSANLQKEKKVGDQLSELSENLKQAQNLLIPISPPEWPLLDIGFISYKNLGISGIYYDFFELPGNTFGIIMVESSTKGAEGVVYTAVMRGMVRSLSRLTTNSIELVSVLNTMLIKDQMKQTFSLSYMFLCPSTNELRYISCGNGSLWMLQKGDSLPVKVPSNNLALGIDPHAQFIDTSYVWNEGDLIVMSTFSPNPCEDTELSEQMFKQMLIDNFNNPPQKLVESIQRKIRIASMKLMEERPVTLVAICRKSSVQNP